MEEHQITGEHIRNVMLEVVEEYSRLEPHQMQQQGILSKAQDKLGIYRNPDLEQALLTYWYDLFRTGFLSWGFNLSNPDPPFCHLTEKGRKVLQNISRDPANPDGYLAYLASLGKLNPIAQSYIDEALQTYNTGCYKATAVMVGASIESVVLELRDVLVTRMTGLGYSPSQKLSDWRIKTILDAMTRELDQHKTDVSFRPLKEAFDSQWPVFIHQIRTARNDTGHPTSVDPVTPDSVHASLLMYPALIKFAFELKDWITIQYK